MNATLGEGLRAEIPGRVKGLQASLAATGLDGALLLHSVDVYYYSGTRQNVALWIPAAGEASLLVRKGAARARSESPLPGVRPFPPGRELAALFGNARRVGLCFDVTRLSQWEWWRKHLPRIDFADASALVRAQRSVKSPLELKALRQGGEKLAAVFREIPSFLRAGMRELDLAAEIELRLRRAGCQGSPRLRAPNLELFSGLVVSGEAGAEPGGFDGPVAGRGLSAAYPVGPSERVIRTGEPVFVDYAALFGGYILDVTRVFALGSLPEDLERAHEVAIAIQDELAPLLAPGQIPADLYARATDRAEAAGLGAFFMGHGEEASRFVGHGLGLELDEMPVLALGFHEPLTEGQVLALEPKFVFPGRGAVGIENSWAVTRGGGERLTPLPDALVRVP